MGSMAHHFSSSTMDPSWVITHENLHVKRDAVMSEFPTDLLSAGCATVGINEAEIERTNGTCWVDYEVNSGGCHNGTISEAPTPLKNDGVKVSWDDYSIPN